jgi:hypothetical protein
MSLSPSTSSANPPAPSSTAGTTTSPPTPRPSCSPSTPPSSNPGSTNHHCYLPTNVRSKVEHCDQVGDFNARQDKGIHLFCPGSFESWPRIIDFREAQPQRSTNSNDKPKPTPQPSANKTDTHPKTGKKPDTPQSSNQGSTNPEPSSHNSNRISNPSIPKPATLE